MFNVSDLLESSMAARSTVPAWRACEVCEELFPGDPGESLCGDCGGDEPAWAERCEAAHPADLSECEGEPDAVRVLDQVGDELRGCVHHAAVVIASIADVWAYPGSVAGAGVEALARAQRLKPFAFDSDTSAAGGSPQRGGPG